MFGLSNWPASGRWTPATRRLDLKSLPNPAPSNATAAPSVAPSPSLSSLSHRSDYHHRSSTSHLAVTKLPSSAHRHAILLSYHPLRSAAPLGFHPPTRLSARPFFPLSIPHPTFPRRLVPSVVPRTFVQVRFTSQYTLAPSTTSQTPCILLC